MSSSSSSGDGGPCFFCTCCLKLVFALGFSALVFWLLYRPIAPRYYIISLSFLTSPTPGNLTSLASASFHLEIENKNKHMGICHDPIALSLVPPRGNLTAARASSSILPAFYQGHQKTAEKYGNFTMGGMGMRNGSGNFVVGVTVESGYRLKVFFWKTRRREVSVGGDVEVGADGKKTAEKGIRLKRSDGEAAVAVAQPQGCCYWLVSAVFFAHYLFSF